MTPEAQRIAIAEACGLSVCRNAYEALGSGNPKRDFFMPEAIEAFRRRWPSGVYSMPVPDYLNDLNAMHEAEKVLNKEDGSDPRARNQFNFYVWCLFEVCTGYPNEREVNDYAGDVMCATAAQRAKAFLRTLGKWEDDK